MDEWKCPKCGFRFLTGTLTGRQRAEKHQAEGCDAPAIPAPLIVSAATHMTRPGVVGKRYPYRAPKPGGH